MYQLISRFDAAVQRHVDATAHFFMRRFGISKGAFRLGLNLFIAITWLARTVVAHAVGLQASERFTIVICTALFLGLAIFSYRIDRYAESSKMTMSPVDAYLVARSPLLKTLMWMLLASETTSFIMSGASRQNRTYALCQLVSWVPMMMLIYLGRTPPNVPPQEERSPARERALVPIPVRSGR